MKNIFAKILTTLTILVIAFTIFSCVSDARFAQVASLPDTHKRIVFYNDVTRKRVMILEGRCVIRNIHKRIIVDCKTSDVKDKTYFFGLSDNITYFVEEIDSQKVSAYHHKVIWEP